MEEVTLKLRSESAKEDTEKGIRRKKKGRGNRSAKVRDNLSPIKKLKKISL